MTTLRFPSESRPPSGNNWNISAIVSELRALRDESLMARQRVGKPTKLPSRKALTHIIESLSTALFPNRLGSRELAADGVDYFVGHTLDVTLDDLVEEILCELHFVSGQADAPEDEQRQRAVAIVREFASRLPSIRALLESDIQAAFEGDPAARSSDEILACYPGKIGRAHV